MEWETVRKGGKRNLPGMPSLKGAPECTIPPRGAGKHARRGRCARQAGAIQAQSR